MGTFRHAGVGNATALTCYASATDVQNGSLVTLSAVGGTGDAITATAPLSTAAYANGQNFRFVATATNTGAATININTIGAKSITKAGTTALAAGDILTGQLVNLVYDGTRFQMIGARQSGSVAAATYNARSSNTILAGSDLGSMNEFTGTFTQTITAAATLGAGWYVDVQNVGTGVITFDANSSETFACPSGARTTICMYPEEGFRLWCNGTGFTMTGRPERVMAYTYTSGGADATVDLEQGFTDGEAGSIDIEYRGVTGSSDLQGRVKKSGAYITGGSYAYAYVTTDFAVGVQNTGTATFFYLNGSSNGALRYGKISISSPTTAVRQQILVDTSEPLTATGPSFRATGGVFENTASALQGLRFYLAAGNITTGTFTVWINRA